MLVQKRFSPKKGQIRKPAKPRQFWAFFSVLVKVAGKKSFLSSRKLEFPSLSCASFWMMEWAKGWTPQWFPGLNDRKDFFMKPNILQKILLKMADAIWHRKLSAPGTGLMWNLGSHGKAAGIAPNRFKDFSPLNLFLHPFLLLSPLPLPLPPPIPTPTPAPFLHLFLLLLPPHSHPRSYSLALPCSNSCSAIYSPFTIICPCFRNVSLPHTLMPQNTFEDINNSVRLCALTTCRNRFCAG